jgi:toxin ParE1/3/4
MRVVITPRAQSDLESIGDYIAAQNPDRASSFVGELRMRCLTLADNPERFPLAERLAAKGVRKLSHGNYLIFYRVYADRITVARVLHGSTDYAAKFSER